MEGGNLFFVRRIHGTCLKRIKPCCSMSCHLACNPLLFHIIFQKFYTHLKCRTRNHFFSARVQMFVQMFVHAVENFLCGSNFVAHERFFQLACKKIHMSSPSGEFPTVCTIPVPNFVHTFEHFFCVPKHVAHETFFSNIKSFCARCIWRAKSFVRDAKFRTQKKVSCARCIWHAKSFVRDANF